MNPVSVVTRPAGVGLCLAAIAAWAFAAEPVLPIAPVRDVVQVLHGVTRTATLSGSKTPKCKPGCAPRVK
jgi:hypothetical protein